MAKISQYIDVGEPKLSDKLIGTSVGLNEDGSLQDVTYNFTLQQLLDLFLPVIPANNLQGVLDYGNTATEDINLFGKITTTNLEVTDTTNLFKAYFEDEIYFEGQLFDKDNSSGLLNQVLSSTVNGVKWVSLPPNYIASLQEVLAKGNTADIDIILDADIDANGVTADNIKSNTSLEINGTLLDKDVLPGTNGQVLVSLGTNVQWQDLPLITAVSPLFFNIATNEISIQVASASQNGYLKATDWINFDAKQNALNGTGIVVGNGGTISYITNNSSNWNSAYANSIISAIVTGGATKTLTLNRQDGGSIIASWTDNSGLSSIGLSMPSAFTVSNTPLTSNGTINVVGSGTSLQYIDGTGALQTFPTIPVVTGFVPYTGATQNVNLGAYDLIADAIIKNGGTASQFLKADGSIDASLYITLASLFASSPLSYDNLTGSFSIQQANASQNGFLSSADWTTFNSKQAAGNYITSLLGEATASGPGAASVLLSNAAVIAKVLTGLNVTGGSISAADSILTAFGKLQNQINGLIGGSTFEGTWDASTNTPTLTSSVGVNGHYYVVSVAGNTNLNGIIDWNVGDWAIFHDSVWQKVDNTDSVISVNGQIGIVNLTTDNIPQGTTNFYFANSLARAALSFAAGSGAYNNTTGVITIPTNNNQIGNGANYITLASLSAGEGINYNNATGVIACTITQYTDALARAAISGGTGISYNNTTGVITNTITQYTDALARAAISLTTIGTSGPATYNSTTGVFNIPQYAPDLSGYVPTSRTLTINGVTQDLSTNRIWNIPTHDAVTIGTANGLSLIGQQLSLGLASGSANGALSSTDWTTFNNKQNALTNPITGTGTTNFLPKFTGATTLGNSLIFDNGTNVGIGTTTPNFARLQVRGNNGSAIAYFFNNTGAAGQVNGLAVEAGTNTSDWSLSIASSLGTSYLRVRGDGNVGINTINPTERLDVNGITRVINPNDPLSGTINAKFLSFAGNPYGFIFRGYANGAHSIQCQRESNNSEVFALTLQPNGGNVGISTITPNAKLEVNGNVLISGASAQLTINNPSYNDAINFSSGYILNQNNFGGELFYYGGQGYMPSGTYIFKSDYNTFEINNAVMGSGYQITLNNYSYPSTGIMGMGGAMIYNDASLSFWILMNGGIFYDQLGNVSGIPRMTFNVNGGNMQFDGNELTINGNPVGGLPYLSMGSIGIYPNFIFNSGQLSQPEFQVTGASNGARFQNTAGQLNVTAQTSPFNYQTITINTNFTIIKNNNSAFYVENPSGSDSLIVDNSQSRIRNNSGNFAVVDSSYTPSIDLNNFNAAIYNFGANFSVYDLNTFQQLFIVSNGDVFANSYNTFSDISLKENIVPVQSALNKVLNLEGVKFDWKRNSKSDYGFIAQQVKEVIPEVVKENEDTGIHTVNYTSIIAIQNEAIKELKKQIDELKNLIK